MYVFDSKTGKKIQVKAIESIENYHSPRQVRRRSVSKNGQSKNNLPCAKLACYIFIALVVFLIFALIIMSIAGGNKSKKGKKK